MRETLDRFCRIRTVLISMRRFEVATVRAAHRRTYLRLTYFKYYFAMRAGSRLVAIYLRPPESVGRSPVFRRQRVDRERRRRVLRFPVRPGNSFTGGGKKKARSGYLRTRRPGSRIVSQSAASCDPRGRKREAPGFRAIGSPPAPGRWNIERGDRPFRLRTF